MTDVALPTRKRGDSLTFVATLEITVDRSGTPTLIDDLDGWDPICQFRRAADGDDVWPATLLGIDGQEITFGISNAVARTMSGDFVGEIELVDPLAPEGFGAITWPGAGSYLTWTVAADVAERDE